MSDKRSSKKSKSNGEALETPTQSSKLNITETSSALSLSSITTISPKSSSATTSVHPLQSTSLDKTPLDPKSTTSSKSSDFSTSTVNPEGQVSYSASSTDSLSNTTLEAQIEKHLEKVDETRKRIKFNTEIHNSGLKRNAHLSQDNASKIIENEFPSDDNEQFNKQFTAIPKHTQLKCSDSRCYERKLGFVPATSGESGDEDENSRRPLHYTVDYHEMNKRFSHGTLAEIYDDEFFSYADRHSDLPNKADLKEGHEQQPPPLPQSPPPTTTGAGVATSAEASGIDNKARSGHITIDIDVKALNGTTDHNDNTIATLTNSGAKQQSTIDDLSSSSNTTGLRNNLSGQRSSVICRVVLATVGVGLLAAIVTLIWYYMGWTFGIPALLVALLVLLLTKPGWRWFYIAGATANRDLTAVFAYIKLLVLIKKYEKKNLTIADIFQTNVAKFPDKTAIVSETQSWTFRQLNEHSNRVANVFHSHGYKKGDVVALLLENRPEFVGTWLGLSKIGVITPLINTNLRGPSLLHSITVAKCSALIYGEGFVSAVEDILKELPSNVALYQFNNQIKSPVHGNAKDLTTLLDAACKDKLPASADRPSHHDKLVYIYTSGTTGLPKAAVISHSRYLFIAAGIRYTLRFQQKDTFYTPLPLYHTAGGIMSMGQSVLFGSTVAIRKKFSASGYFSDCIKFNATIGQYIGEMARYVLATPPSENDRKHHIRLVFGNGMRPQIWTQFVERFSIPQIGEFYGATEGNANIMNHDNTVGAIGFVSRILPKIYPISIIRADQDTGEPIRGPDGLCQLCKPNEPGVFIGKIIKGNPSREFLGYVDEKASAKKIVRDVFKKGDMAFLSGDLLVADEKGYLYFKDRTGDTFRWKGENVSTSEVEAQVSNVAGYKDTVVYGVTIPNTEGRAGMAAIYDPERQVDLDKFSENLAKVLPTYARPQFLRFLTKIDLTGTFKLRKVDLQKEGYDPKSISDVLYYQTPKGKYEMLTNEIYDLIKRNEMRF